MAETSEAGVDLESGSTKTTKPSKAKHPCIHSIYDRRNDLGIRNTEGKVPGAPFSYVLPLAGILPRIELLFPQIQWYETIYFLTCIRKLS